MENSIVVCGKFHCNMENSHCSHVEDKFPLILWNNIYKCLVLVEEAIFSFLPEMCSRSFVYRKWNYFGFYLIIFAAVCHVHEIIKIVFH